MKSSSMNEGPMNCAKTLMKNQWKNIGSLAFKHGLAVDAVLTSRESIDEIIRKGYESARKKFERSERMNGQAK